MNTYAAIRYDTSAFHTKNRKGEKHTSALPGRRYVQNNSNKRFPLSSPPCRVLLYSERWCEHIVMTADAAAAPEIGATMSQAAFIHPLRVKNPCSRRLMRLSKFSSPDFCFFGSDLPCECQSDSGSVGDRNQNEGKKNSPRALGPLYSCTVRE
jgi:site-specific DNA-cytosine methylase